MQSEKPERALITTSQGPIRPLRRGFSVYLVAAVVIAAVCYLFGWWTVACVGTGYLYGAVFLVIFGLCMVAGNLMPLQLSHVKDVTSQSATNQNTPIDKTGSAQKGAMLLAITLISAALLGLTGGLIKLLFNG